MAIPAGIEVRHMSFPVFNIPEPHNETFLASHVNSAGGLRICVAGFNDGAHGTIYNCMLHTVMCYSMDEDTMAYLGLSNRANTMLQPLDPVFSPHDNESYAVATTLPTLGLIWQSEKSDSLDCKIVFALNLVAACVHILGSTYIYRSRSYRKRSFIKGSRAIVNKAKSIIFSSLICRIYGILVLLRQFASLRAIRFLWSLRLFFVAAMIQGWEEQSVRPHIMTDPTNFRHALTVYILPCVEIVMSTLRVQFMSHMEDEAMATVSPTLHEQHISLIDKEGRLSCKPCSADGQNDTVETTADDEPSWRYQESSAVSSTKSSRSSSPKLQTISSSSSIEQANSETLFDEASSISDEDSLDDIAIELQQHILNQADKRLLPSIIRLVFSLARGGTSQVCIPYMYGNGSGRAPQKSNSSQPSLGDSAHGFCSNKRLRVRNEGEPNNNEEQESVPEKSSYFDRSQTTFRKLACPFHKSAPRKYREGSMNGKQYKTCPRGFKDTKDLSEHLKDVHRGPKFLCKRCSAIFKTEDAATQHQRQTEPCKLWINPEFGIEGYIMSDERCKALKKKLPSKSIEEHWFSIWDVLFPNQERPTSIYQDFEQLDNAFNQAIEIAIPAFVEQQFQAVGWSDYDADQYLRRFAETLRQHLWDRYEAEAAARFGTTRLPPSTLDESNGATVNSRIRARTNNVDPTFQHSALNPHAASHENVHDFQNDNTDRDSVHILGHYTSQNQDISFWTQQQQMATPAIGQGISTALFPHSSNQANITSTDDALPDLVPNNDDLFDLYDRWNQE